ncbi:MAG: CPBP family intramembrane metalloprotease [Clostridiaceae bacterium]|nr:CPBP family intramembrane metalloprotease [Clostridiaceae bacterium]
MMQIKEEYVHRGQSLPAVPSPPGRRITARTFLAPLILMVLHHLVLNGISVARTFTYLLSNPSVGAELQQNPLDSSLLMKILVDSKAMTYASLFGMLILIPAYLFYLYRRKKKQTSLIMRERVSWGQTLSALAVILGALGLTQFWMALLSLFDPASFLGQLFADYVDKMVFFDAGASTSVFDLLATVLLVPLGEELLFRGIIQGELRKSFSPAISVVATTVLFAVFHLDLIQGSYVLIAGLALSLVYQLTRNLLMPIVMHMVFNLIGSGWLTRLTGAGQAAEAILVYSLYGFVLIGLGGLLILRKADRKRDGSAV